MSATEAHERSRQFVLARIERLGLDVESSESTSFAIDHRILPGHTFDSLSARPAAAREIARRLMTEDREAIDVLRRRTQSLHRGRIDILGLSEVDAGNPPRWHREVLTGLEAPTRHWSKIAYLDPAQVGDHKVLWEINR